MTIARSSLIAFAALSLSTATHAVEEPKAMKPSGESVIAAVAPLPEGKAETRAELKAENATEKPTGDGTGLVAAKPAPAARPEPTLIAKVDLTTQRLTVVVDGKPAHTWPISSGAQGYSTPVGSFTPGWKAKMWYSKQYDDAPMPHSVFFKNGAAIHATQAVGSLGRPASHGCVRLAPANAATFYGLVGKHGLSQTRVVVFGAPKHAPAIAQRSQPSYAAGAPRVMPHRTAYNNMQPRHAAVPAYAPSYPSSGFNNGGSWFGGNGYAAAQAQPVRYIAQPGGYYGQRVVRYLPRGYRPY